MRKIILLVEDMPATETKDQPTRFAKQTLVQADQRPGVNAQASRASCKNVMLFVQNNHRK